MCCMEWESFGGLSVDPVGNPPKESTVFSLSLIARSLLLVRTLPNSVLSHILCRHPSKIFGSQVFRGKLHTAPHVSWSYSTKMSYVPFS